MSIDDLNESEPVVVIKYVLLNPSERFKEVVEEARSVILAGGTMEPVCLHTCFVLCSRTLTGIQITDFLQQLFPSIPKDRLSTLSCSHVIPKENLLTQVVSVGPRKSEFEFKFGNRNDEALVSYTRKWFSSGSDLSLAVNRSGSSLTSYNRCGTRRRRCLPPVIRFLG